MHDGVWTVYGSIGTYLGAPVPTDRELRRFKELDFGEDAGAAAHGLEEISGQKEEYKSNIYNYCRICYLNSLNMADSFQIPFNHVLFFLDRENGY